MLLFSCWLVGWTPVRWRCDSLVMAWQISGESPFSSKACRHGKLGGLLNKTGCFPVVGLPVEPPWTSLLLSPLAGTTNVFSPSLKPKVSLSLTLSPEFCNWLNFTMHSSIRAGGAFLCGTVTRPQNSTSNLLAKFVENTRSADATVVGVVEREEPPVSEELLPLVGNLLTLSLRAELFPAFLNTLMISGTCGISKNRGKRWNHWRKD